MRVLQINTVVGIGSTGRIVSSIAKTIEDTNGKAYIAYGHGLPFSEKDYSIGTRFEKRIHAHLYSELLDKHGLGSIEGTLSLIKWIKSVNPDIIHLHNLHGNYLNYKLLFQFINKERIPIVWTFHDCWPITGHCTHFDNIGCRKWIGGCYKCPLIHDYPTSWFIDNSKNNYYLKRELFSSIEQLTIIPVSYWLGDVIRHSFLRQKTIIPIHNGINTVVFSPKDGNSLRERLVSKGQSLILGVSTSWGAMKGLDEFVEISKNRQFKVVLIGVPSKLRGSLPKDIISIERTNSQEELAQYYSAADVLVNPTYNDSFPTINLEAIACGTPVVTYRTGGSPETIDAMTGIVVDKGNYKALDDAIHTIVYNGKSSYSVSCREKAENEYNQNKCYQQYIDIYHEILLKQ